MKPKNDDAMPLSPAHEAMFALRDAGRVKWNGGKPEGLRGYAVRGKPISETVIEDRGPTSTVRGTSSEIHEPGARG